MPGSGTAARPPGDHSSLLEHSSSTLLAHNKLYPDRSRFAARSAEALREVGRPGRATHLLPCAPSGPTRFRPLREAWLGLGPTSCTGPREWTLAARVLLGCDPWPSHPGRELVESRERPSALSVVVCAEELDLLDAMAS